MAVKQGFTEKQQAQMNAAGMMDQESASKSAQYYRQKMNEIWSGPGTTEEKRAAHVALAEEQLNNPYRTGNQAYDDYANALSQGYVDTQVSLGQSKSAAEDALEAQIDRAVARMEAQRPKIQQQYEDSQRQAYIQSMKAKKNLPQQMAAMGMTGGAAESSMLDLENQYGNARNGYQQSYNNALEDLDAQINDVYASGVENQAALEQQYRQLLAEYQNNYANNLATAKLQAQLQQAQLQRAELERQDALAQQQWQQAFQQAQADRDWDYNQALLQWEKDKYAQEQARAASAGGSGSGTGGTYVTPEYLRQLRELMGLDDEEDAGYNPGDLGGTPITGNPKTGFGFGGSRGKIKADQALYMTK